VTGMVQFSVRCLQVLLAILHLHGKSIVWKHVKENCVKCFYFYKRQR
jgi:hypothetical protein